MVYCNKILTNTVNTHTICFWSCSLWPLKFIFNLFFLYFFRPQAETKTDAKCLSISSATSLGNQLVTRLLFPNFFWQQTKLARSILSAWASVSQPRFAKYRSVAEPNCLILWYMKQCYVQTFCFPCSKKNVVEKKQFTVIIRAILSRYLV